MIPLFLGRSLICDESSFRAICLVFLKLPMALIFGLVVICCQAESGRTSRSILSFVWPFNCLHSSEAEIIVYLFFVSSKVLLQGNWSLSRALMAVMPPFILITLRNPLSASILLALRLRWLWEQ